MPANIPPKTKITGKISDDNKDDSYQKLQFSICLLVLNTNITKMNKNAILNFFDSKNYNTHYSILKRSQ